MLDFGETLIQENSSPESLCRGRVYYRRGCVTSLVRWGEELRAEVEGSGFAPYEVRLAFDAAGVTGAACSCPYEWGGWCKHIVAVLLATLHDPESVRETPSLEERLSEMDRGQLVGVLRRLAEIDPLMAEAIEKEVSGAGSSDAPRADVDTRPVRREVRSIIHSLDHMRPSEAYWHVGGVVDEVRRVLDGAWERIEARDERATLRILDAITDEYSEAWEYLDDSNGEVGEFFHDLGAAWAEAVLGAGLSESERRDWRAKLGAHYEGLEMYAGGEAFDAALLTLGRRQGDPFAPSAPGEPEDRFPAWVEGHDRALTSARLNVLDRQGRHEEYLRLAEQAGEASRRAVMLARLGRIEEAAEYALARLEIADDALAVAEALRENGDMEAAIAVGERGLSLSGRKSALAAWVRSPASGAGRTGLALEAASIAFRENPALSSYRRVREAADTAGEDWPKTRAGLLDHIRRRGSGSPAGRVEVFLHEGLVGDAIAAVERSPVGAPLEDVADAAAESHPDWVIGVSRPRAERIMDEGESKYYGKAIDWLRRARAAHRAASREHEWRTYIEELIVRHQRKRKLRPMLEDLAK